MKFECYSDLALLPDSANALFEQGEKGSIFFSRPWFENLATALEDDQVMLLACVVADNKFLAILPLIKSAGNNYSSLKHRYTTHYSLLLADPEHEQESAEAGQFDLPKRHDGGATFGPVEPYRQHHRRPHPGLAVGAEQQTRAHALMDARHFTPPELPPDLLPPRVEIEQEV